jgi:hypothetical protein
MSLTTADLIVSHVSDTSVIFLRVFSNRLTHSNQMIQSNQSTHRRSCRRLKISLGRAVSPLAAATSSLVRRIIQTRKGGTRRVCTRTYCQPSWRLQSAKRALSTAQAAASSEKTITAAAAKRKKGYEHFFFDIRIAAFDCIQQHCSPQRPHFLLSL